MAASTLTFPDFLDQVPASEQDAILPELEEVKVAWDAEDGLVPKAALKEIFQMSQQAAHQLPGKYGLTEYRFFGKDWYSKRECEALHKLKRETGGRGHNIARMVRDVLDDARKD